MNEAITLAQLGAIAGLIGTVLGVAFFIFRAISTVKDVLHKRITDEMAAVNARMNNQSDRLHALDVKASETYATYGELRQTESRLTDAVEKLTDRIDALIAQMQTGKGV